MEMKKPLLNLKCPVLGTAKSHVLFYHFQTLHQ